MNRYSCVGLGVGLASALFVGSQLHTATGQVSVFFTGFEYSGGEPIVGIDAANLNGADGQIGSFSGTFPDGTGQFSPELIGFETNPNGGRLMWLDRPTAAGSFSADFSSSILVDGATVSFDVASRRTVGGATDKDYDIIGFDSINNESFHLNINTQNGQERLGVVTDNGGTLTLDLPTTSGDDADEDLNNTGGTPFTVSDLANIRLSLAANGYTIDFARDAQSYTTDVISYNGSASELSRIEFTYQGGDSNPVRTGYLLDNVTAIGTLADGSPMLGDFNADGVVNESDFDILAVNLGAHLDGFVSHEHGDVTFDGRVDLADFIRFKEILDGPAAVSGGLVPEPTSVACLLLLLAAVPFVRLR